MASGLPQTTQDRIDRISLPESLEPNVHFGEAEAVLPSDPDVRDCRSSFSYPFNSHAQVVCNFGHIYPRFGIKFIHNGLVYH